MSLTREDIRGIAKLARLSLSPEEEIRYAEQLTAVLSYIDTLNEVDVESVSPTTQVTGLEDVVREDVVVASAPEKRDTIVDLFPHTEKGMLLVPRVFEDQ